MKSPKHLLVILGHTNDKTGQLSESGANRAKQAAALLAGGEFDGFVTTGAFGKNFNEGSVPHGQLLAQAISKELAGRRSTPYLGHTPTAFTEEDIYAVRRYTKDNNFELVTFLTSTFHLERVRAIASLVFRDSSVLFQQAKDGADITDEIRDCEKEKIRGFVASWVDAPLYVNGKGFPAEIFKNAFEQYKHADGISLAILTAAVLIGAFPQTIAPSRVGLHQVGMLITCTMTSAALFTLYVRYAMFANLARHLMRAIELGWSPGYQYNTEKLFLLRWPRMKLFRTPFVVAAIAALLLAGNILTVVLAFLAWKASSH